MPSVSAASLDAVTVDAFGTLVLLEDPTDRLRAALGEAGVERPRDVVRAAFETEARYYRPRSLRGRDGASLAALRLECVRVFLEAAGADVDPAAFVPRFMASIVFRLADGAEMALDALRGAGLALACVANWDAGLIEHLKRVGVDDRFDVVLSSAEAGAEKPDRRIFDTALARLGISADRALHIGDEAADRDGAAAGGLAFEPVPLATLPERLGL
jgi:putative hydrolase of the HAD superfamily